MLGIHDAQMRIVDLPSAGDSRPEARPGMATALADTLYFLVTL
jgi:hypothetical protein